MITTENKPASNAERGRRMICLLIVIILLPVIFLAGKSAMSRQPASLGVKNGQLAGCPRSPNCVSTQADNDKHAVEPLPLHGSAEDAMTRLKSVIAEMPRTDIVTAEDSYLHVEFRTLVFRFVDDVEFQMDADAKLIQIRSASRTGYSDLGANRTRVQVIRAAWAAASKC